ncbi:MAG: glutamine synthetase family protein [Acidimicrobiales bacterium]
MTAAYTDFSRIRLLWPDQHGLARGKYVPGDLAHKGSGFCATTFGMTYNREIIDAPHAYLMEGLKDVHGTPDLGSLRPSWEDDRTGVAVAHLALDHKPYAASSRAALEKGIADWVALGYAPKIGIELEGYLLEPRDDGGWGAYRNPRSMVYGTGLLGDPSGFLDAVMEMSDACGFRIESANVEFDESQFEFTLRYDDALKAVDDAFVFRVMVREVALAMGLDFTFLGKPFPAIAGSGTHINFSLTDADGNPAMADDADPDGVSDLARSCVAGLVEHHCALTAVVASNVNAYRRLQPGTLAGCWGNWGIDHRNVTNRMPAERGSAMRIESRVGDGAMNVHLAVAGILQAARLGLVDQHVAPAAYLGDGFDDGGTGAARSATSLERALDDLEADEPFVEALGSGLVANYAFNKRHEAMRFAESGGSIDSPELTAFELANYLPYH